MLIYESNGKTAVSFAGSIKRTHAEIERIMEEYFPGVPWERIRFTQKLSIDAHKGHMRIVLSQV